MRITRKLSEANIYHVIQRGTGRQLIFEDDEDRRLFLRLLSNSVQTYDVEVFSWCLMGNHFHLLLRAPIDAVSGLMKEVCGGYATIFNARHGRVGHLFQERYKSEPVNSDEYLMIVVRYIHQNPEKAGFAATAEWPWSSFGEYTGSDCGKCEIRCTTDFVLGCFGSVEAFVGAHRTLCEETDCIDVFRLRNMTRAMPDEDAIALSEVVLGPGALNAIKTWEKAQRDEGLRTLRKSGLSVRQIERLTGIGRNIIANSTKENEKAVR